MGASWTLKSSEVSLAWVQRDGEVTAACWGAVGRCEYLQLGPIPRFSVLMEENLMSPSAHWRELRRSSRVERDVSHCAPSRGARCTAHTFCGHLWDQPSARAPARAAIRSAGTARSEPRSPRALLSWAKLPRGLRARGRDFCTLQILFLRL